MKNVKPRFTENDQVLVGHLTTDSGTLLLSDGIWSDSLPVVGQSGLLMDLENERSSFPIYATMHGNKRYLIVALDEKVEVQNRETGIVETVEVEEAFTETDIDKIYDNAPEETSTEAPR